MKHLPLFILESLFDTSKNITDTHELEKSMFEDENSDFWKYLVPILVPNATSLIRKEIRNVKKEIDISKEVIDMADEYVSIDSNNENPFINKYDLICKELFIGNPNASGPHPEPIANGGGFKEIRCQRVCIDGMAEKLSGFKFVIVDGGVAGRVVDIRWAENLDYLDAEFHWINNFNSVMCISGDDFLNLKNVKSNAKKISIYDCNFFDNTRVKTKLDNFFGKGSISINGVLKSKSTRNIVAITNNIRKYGSLDPDQIIPVGKLSDLMDIKGFSDLEKITLRSNNVEMTFVKPTDDEAIKRHARFIRINNLKKYKDTPIEEIEDMVRKCQTKDGWVLIAIPGRYG